MSMTTQRTTHFLLVEDDDDQANLFQMSMNRLGSSLSVTRLRNGEEALSYLKQEHPYEDAERPDLVLLDLNMPRMSGHDVIAEMNKYPELSVIPVVIVTSSDDDSDRKRAYAAHASGYVVKPIEFGKFQCMVNDIEDFWAQWNRPCPG